MSSADKQGDVSVQRKEDGVSEKDKSQNDAKSDSSPQKRSASELGQTWPLHHKTLQPTNQPAPNATTPTKLHSVDSDVGSIGNMLLLGMNSTDETKQKMQKTDHKNEKENGESEEKYDEDGEDDDDVVPDDYDEAEDGEGDEDGADEDEDEEEEA